MTDAQVLMIRAIREFNDAHSLSWTELAFMDRMERAQRISSVDEIQLEILYKRTCDNK